MYALWIAVKVQLILGLFTASFTPVKGKFVYDHLKTRESWVFLERFCFLSFEGSFEFNIEYNSADGELSLLMYPDLQWNDAYRNPKADTCEKKMKVLRADPPYYQVIKLTPTKFPLDVASKLIYSSGYDYESGCEPVNHPIRKISPPPEANSTQVIETSVTNIVCKNSRRFKSARERWWFIAVSNCNSSKGIDMHYKFWMKNGVRGDYWYEHFSADEFYILPILTAFCFVYLFLLFCAMIFAVELKCRQLFHTTYKLFLVSMALQTAGIMMLCIAYGNYASNGIGLPLLKLAGRILEAGSEFVFVLLLLLLAKGFTVTRGRLRPASAVKLTLFNCSYVLVYSLLFVLERYTFDPGLVLYIYESEAGYGILVLRIIGYLMFVYGIFFTLKHYPEKSSFYIPFFGIFSIWFISGPIVILISNYVIDKWVREKVAVSIQHTIAFVGHVVFLGLTRPSAANKSFPYHVRTTQVGMSDGGGAGGDADRFEPHSYAPSYVDGNGRTVDIFTVTGVVQRNTNGVPNLDVFNASGSVQPSIPAIFPMATAPKFNDAFPHQKPGEVEDMLKETEDSGAETGNGSAEEEESEETSQNGRTPPPPSYSTVTGRASRYVCD